MPTSRDIRQQFIDYFVKKQDHRFAPSSPVVPHDDPTLLFANAGMNQFKPYFLGSEKPEHPRAANTQKCIRAGGKHNDLDDVGRDTYHHTFFEMLGNWSFGNYFKKDAIDWAWDLLVNVWGIEPDRLHATYFEGDESEGLAPDDEARDLWRQYLPDDRIHPGNKKDNFWEMGDTGPCGPCSELHYDGTPDLSGSKLVNADDPRVIEIWNLVFIQFNRGAEGKLASLPAKHVDTGMGFERVVRVLQGKQSNYDTDVFTPLFSAIQKVTGARGYDGGEGTLTDAVDIAYRVIADHIRCLTFALTDGAHCGNDGRNYVLRRILRRAVRYGRQTLGVQQPFFYKLVDTVVENFGDAFPELAKNPAAVAAELKDEEESFGRTLDRGIALFDEAAQRAEQKTIAADDAFRLHDTFGFPLDLTQLMAEERGMTVDVEGFETLMEQARERSREGAGDGVDYSVYLTELVQQESLPATEFIGYASTEVGNRKTSLRVYQLDGHTFRNVESVKVGEDAVVVAGASPFYAESGGQIGDAGVIQVAGGGRFKVRDTQKVGDVWFHIGSVVGGELSGGDDLTVSLAVDKVRRMKIMANHTSTHVMNRALRNHVNADADQRGSLVDDEKLRFDFSHSAALTDDELEAVEKQVNADIAADLPVYATVAPQEDALKISGLRAVFGEKYPPKVRVVSIGAKVEDLLADPGNDAWKQLSIEFCGGTHLPRTGDAEGFVFISQEAVSKGVRRVTALTGQAAYKATTEAQSLIGRLDALSQAPMHDDRDRHLDEAQAAIGAGAMPLLLRRKLQGMMGDLAQKQKDQAKADGSKAQEVAVELARAIADEQSGDIIVAKLPGVDGKSLRAAMDVIKKRHPDAALLLGGEAEGKVAFIAVSPEPMIKKGLKAGDWVKEAAKVTGGGGGGRPDMAQAGGKDPAKLDDALEAGKAFAAGKLG